MQMYQMAVHQTATGGVAERGHATVDGWLQQGQNEDVLGFL